MMIRFNRSASYVRFRHKMLVRSMLAAALLILGYSSDALAAGSISGQITSLVTHLGIAGGTVQFYNFNANEVTPAFATVDGNGNYTKTLPDGTYAVLTQNTQGYINKAWNNISCSAICDVNSIT